MIEIIALVLALVSVFLVALIFFTRRSTAYIFCNATISAWEAKLLGESRMMELAETPSYQSLLAALSESEYQSSLREAGKEKAEVIEIEKALHDHVAARFKELLEMLPEERKDTVKKMYQKTDLWNLKTIITMIHNKLPKEARERELIASPVTPKDKVNLLASAESIEELLEFLKGGEYFEAVSGSIEDYKKYGLAPINAALDRHYYSRLWEDVLSKKSQRKILKTTLGFLIDSVNVKLILRLKREGVPPQDIDKYLIRPSHELTETMLKAMATAEDISSAAHMIHITTVGQVLKEVSEKMEKEGVQVAERALDEYYLRMCRWSSMVNFFGIAPTISYTAQKENEMRNLRAVVRLKADGVSPREIKETLTRVPKIEL